MATQSHTIAADVLTGLIGALDASTGFLLVEANVYRNKGDEQSRGIALCMEGQIGLNRRALAAARGEAA